MREWDCKNADDKGQSSLKIMRYKSMGLQKNKKYFQEQSFTFNMRSRGRNLAKFEALKKTVCRIHKRYTDTFKVRQSCTALCRVDSCPRKQKKHSKKLTLEPFSINGNNYQESLFPGGKVQNKLYKIQGQATKRITIGGSERRINNIRAEKDKMQTCDQSMLFT